MLAPQVAYSTGIYWDLSRTAYFVIAPPVFSLEGRASRVEAPNNEATVYTVASFMPLRTFLFQLEIPYISVVTQEAIQNEFGDPVFRLRVRLVRGDERALHLLGGIRLGSLPFLESNEQLFPYSTGSLDLSLGLAFVDTVGAVPWWISATGTMPTRVDTAIADTYTRSSSVAGGAMGPLTDGVRLMIGALVTFQSGQTTRFAYYADLNWSYSATTGFYTFGQAESGSEDTRTIDYSVGIGTRITF